METGICIGSAFIGGIIVGVWLVGVAIKSGWISFNGKRFRSDK